MRSRQSYMIVGLTFFAIAAFAIGLTNRQQLAPTEAAAPHFWSDPSMRTIVVAERGQQLTSKPGVLLTEVVEGALPAGIRTATVLSDSNCAPDANGISHCLNQMQVGAAKMTVQHHHDMRAVPCLSPGETVNVIDVELFETLPSS